MQSGGEKRESKKFGLSEDALKRLEWLVYAERQNISVKDLCEHFGISPTTYHRWAKVFDPRDLTTLENRPTTPPEEKRRKPQTSDHVIALIEQYRRTNPQMGKEKIAETLRKEHDIELSPATIGREIQRNVLYFADTPSHRLKRLQVEVEATRKPNSFVSARRKNVITQIHRIFHRNTDSRGSNGMFAIATLFLVFSVMASLFSGAQTAYALEGSSFQIHTTYSNQAAEAPLVGSVFQLQEAELTNTQKPLTGSNFQVVLGDAASSESTSSSSSSSSSDTTEETTTLINGGGRRSIPTYHLVYENEIEDQRAAKLTFDLPDILIPSFPYPSSIQEEPEPAFSQTVPVRQHTAAPPQDVLVVSPLDHEEIDIIESEPMHSTADEPVAREAYFSITNVLRLLPFVLLLMLGKLIIVLRNHPLQLHRTLCGIVDWKQPLVAFGKKNVRCAIIIMIAVSMVLLFLWNVTQTFAATTVSLNEIYNGHLLDASGDAVTTEHTIRFSYWTTADFKSNELTATGAINTSTGTYVGWYEEHTFTPTSDGSFSVKLGSVTALPTIDSLPVSTLTSLHLQVEVKVSGAADSTYDLLDVDSSDTTVDRTQVHSVPFARNADMLDQRDTGTTSGSILVLQSGALLSAGGDITINDDNEARDAILTFGNDALAETLRFSDSTNGFIFSDDVEVQGTMSGTTIHAEQGLTSSGTLVVAGTITGASLAITNITNCSALDTDANGDVYCNDNRANLDNLTNGVILETIDVDICADDQCVTDNDDVKIQLQADGGGDLTMKFSDGFSTLDTTPRLELSLTNGSDSSPTLNYIYVPQSTKTLTVSTSNWPSEEHAPIATVLIQSVATVKGSGAYKLHAWTDHISSTNNQGHIANLNKWIRNQNATYQSGVSQTTTVTTNGASEDNVDFATTAGVVLQLHDHYFSSTDTAGTGKLLVVNDSSTPYRAIGDINEVDAIDDGSAINNKNYFSVVIWGAVGENIIDNKMFLNLPSCTYNRSDTSIEDAGKCTNYNIPSDYNGVGFLISRLTFVYLTSQGGTWALVDEEDLRGQIPSISAGGNNAILSEFADNAFEIFDDNDSTKLGRFQLSSIATNNLITLTWPTATGTILTKEVATIDYVNVSGDTMTGALVIDNEGSEPSMNVRGTMSGQSLYVTGTGATPLIFTDITTGNVGIGTTAPEARLQVTGGGLCVGSDTNCNAEEDAEGVVYSSSTLMTQYDLAEMYPTKDASIEPGEIVSLDLENGVFVKRAESGDKKLIGVISTDPGSLLGGFAGNQFTEEHQVAVALAGRVPVHVSTENGAIEVGDYLTISSVPGVARKANDGEQAIGYALEPYFGSEIDDIQVFIQLERAQY